MRSSLSLIRRVITVLKTECQEARFVLQPWRVESLVIREADEDTCICERVAGTDTRIDEIAADISKMLLQAQQLREKLSLNVMREKKRQRQPDVRTIYTSGKAPNEPRRSVSNKIKSGTVLKDVRSVKGEKTRSYKTAVAAVSGAVCGNISKDTVDSSSDTTKKSSYKNTRDAESTLRNSSSQIRKHLTSNIDLSLKSTSSKELKKGKNFIAANKLSVKNLSQERNRKAISEQRLKSPGPSTTMKACAASTTELNNLIEKISLNSTKSMSMPYLCTINDECPFHGIGAPRIIEKLKVETFDAIEALDRFGVHEEILKVLKVYHAYMQSKITNQSVSGTKSPKVVNVFLAEFNKMNDIMQDRFTPKGHLQVVAAEFMSIYKDIVREDVIQKDVLHARSKCEELDALYRIDDMKEFDIGEPIQRNTDESALYNPFVARGWMSNGIWNGGCVEDVVQIFRSSCIRYSNSSQLQSLFVIMQQLQQVNYLKILIDYILNCLIPKVKRYPRTSDADYARIYKMIIIVSQGLNSQTPVLVRTDM